MSLACTAWLRHVFADQPAQRAAAELQAPLIGVLSADAASMQRIAEPLAEVGFWVEEHESPDSLIDSLQVGSPPRLLVLDLTTTQDVPGIRSALASARQPSPVVCIVPDLERQVVDIAYELGAVDVFLEPVSTDRLKAGIEAALRQAQVRKPDGTAVQARTRVLLMSSDAALTSALVPSLRHLGYEVDLCTSRQDAIDRAAISSYIGLFLDAPDGPADVLGIVRDLRSLPGIGTIPVLFLTRSATAAPAIPRCATRPRSDAPVVLAGALGRLVADTRHGRTFVRYAVDLEVELRYAARTFLGHTMNVSRGGLSARCEQLVPIGTMLSLTIHLSGSENVQAVARVAHATPPATVGVEFERFALDGEKRLIDFLTQLGATAVG